MDSKTLISAAEAARWAFREIGRNGSGGVFGLRAVRNFSAGFCAVGKCGAAVRAYGGYAQAHGGSGCLFWGFCDTADWMAIHSRVIITPIGG